MAFPGLYKVTLLYLFLLGVSVKQIILENVVKATNHIKKHKLQIEYTSIYYFAFS
jgi:hypothetical protein